MTRSEFLNKLKEALANDLSGPVIQENVNYYSGYIADEVRKGRSEEEVVAELGDPWAIARTIIESLEIQGNTQEDYGYEPNRQNYDQRQQSGTGQVHIFGLDTWWKKLLLVLGIVGVFMLVIAVIGGIFSLLAPILVPLILVIIVFRIIGSRR
ncbi:DUF1700 domain-containing protein [[Clostridium] scindens]|uniref:DUF1700 domain-containing protein n=1 Tax=Clostridium scindens (strain JCM 10418 / VPI 12708) TaxID=29347 RepID=UPI003AF05D83